MGALKTKILYGIEWYRGLDLEQDNISVSVLPLVYDIVTKKCQMSEELRAYELFIGKFESCRIHS